MSAILNGLEGAVYQVDDILVYGKDKPEHDRRLGAVLQRLEEAGITLNREKCEFYKDRGKFLGHIIDASGIRPDPDKVKAILSMPEPTNVSDVRRVLGIVNHLSKFSPKLADPFKHSLARRMHGVGLKSTIEHFSP